MKDHRSLRYLAPILAIATILALPDLIQAGDKGGRGSAGQTASGRTGGGGGGSASATPSRRVGNNGGLVGPRPHHGGGGTRVVIGGWPWWGYGVGWGWSGWGYWGYDPWYYPAYGYNYGYGYPAYRSYGAYGDGPTSAAVELHVSPRKASVKVDGYDVGQARDFSSSYTPLILTPGDHVIELSYPEHQTLKLRVHGSAGQGLDLRYELAEGEGVDPRSETAEVGVPARPAEAGDEGAVTPPPAAGERERLKTGSIRVRVEPDDAAVYLDGEFLGMADELRNLHGALAIATGEHTLEASRPGFRTQSIKVTIGAAAAETVKLELQPGMKD